MTHWTEDRIRECLDGTFTRVTYEGRIEVIEVDHDYRPGHGNSGRKSGTTCPKGQALWTPAEDELLCQMRLRNRPFNEIAWLISRTEASAKKRHHLLRARGLVAA